MGPLISSSSLEVGEDESSEQASILGSADAVEQEEEEEEEEEEDLISVMEDAVEVGVDEMVEGVRPEVHAFSTTTRQAKVLGPSFCHLVEGSEGGQERQAACLALLPDFFDLHDFDPPLLHQVISGDYGAQALESVQGLCGFFIVAH